MTSLSAPPSWLTRMTLIALTVGMLSGCVGQTPGRARIPEFATVTHRAAFIGESDHDTTGTVSLYQSDEPAVIVFEQNFSLSPVDGAVVALGRDGYQPDAVLGRLYRAAGRQAYAVPGRLRIEAFNEVWIWSTRTGRPVGLARLTRL